MNQILQDYTLQVNVLSAFKEWANSSVEQDPDIRHRLHWSASQSFNQKYRYALSLATTQSATFHITKLGIETSSPSFTG